MPMKSTLPVQLAPVTALLEKVNVEKSAVSNQAPKMTATPRGIPSVVVSPILRDTSGRLTAIYVVWANRYYDGEAARLRDRLRRG